MQTQVETLYSKSKSIEHYENKNGNKVMENMVPTCPSGTTYNPSINMCAAPATCPANFRISNGQCIQNISQSGGEYEGGGG